MKALVMSEIQPSRTSGIAMRATASAAEKLRLAKVGRKLRRENRSEEIMRGERRQITQAEAMPQEIPTFDELIRRMVNKRLRRPWARKCYWWAPNWIPTLRLQLYLQKMAETFLIRAMEHYFTSTAPSAGNTRNKGDRMLESETAMFAAFSQAFSFRDKTGNEISVSFVPHRINGNAKTSNEFGSRQETNGKSENGKHGYGISVYASHSKTSNASQNATVQSPEMEATAIPASGSSNVIEFSAGLQKLLAKEIAAAIALGMASGKASKPKNAPEIEFPRTIEFEPSQILENNNAAPQTTSANGNRNAASANPQAQNSPANSSFDSFSSSLSAQLSSAQTASVPLFTVALAPDSFEPDFSSIPNVPLQAQPAIMNFESQANPTTAMAGMQASQNIIQLPTQSIPEPDDVPVPASAPNISIQLHDSNMVRKRMANSNPKAKGGMTYFFARGKALVPPLMHDPTAPTE